MLRSLALLLFLLFACQKINYNTTNLVNLNLQLTTPEKKLEYSVIKNRLDSLFAVSQKTKHNCLLKLGIVKKKQTSGITSSTFSVNMNITVTVKYSLTCTNNIKTNGIITLDDDIALVQERTVGQFVGEQQATEGILNKIAVALYEEIILLFAMHK